MLSVKLGTADGYASEEQVACIGGNGTIDELKEQRRHNVTGWTKQLLQSMTFCQSFSHALYRLGNGFAAHQMTHLD
ncbi:hypothetical protein T09_6454 [Trichinella sp. T9]|uniref:Uncharacterized protein n=1 Tax=Trichinella murrelli TaxID=144512 RepID=A0A0V0UCL2_9BILA|nr:hypothetical protein T05_3493 [Trichinella murrelli]KRX62020.1 hypothetical protein T09_6454 [Trichinella sp. T9]KRZ98019.1 hypothetical protein T08_12765 [Trichinella sp. T8]